MHTHVRAHKHTHIFSLQEFLNSCGFYVVEYHGFISVTALASHFLYETENDVGCCLH